MKKLIVAAMAVIFMASSAALTFAKNGPSGKATAAVSATANSEMKPPVSSAKKKHKKHMKHAKHVKKQKKQGATPAKPAVPATPATPPQQNKY